MVASAVAVVLVVTLSDLVVRPQSALAVPAGPPEAPAADVPLERPDEMAALTTARMTGRRVKITNLTSETSEFWALPDGLVEAEIHAGPVRFRDEHGQWVAVDVSLERRSDGSVGSKAHPYGLRLSGAASEGEHDLVTLGQGQDASSVGWSGRLPEPVLDGTTATYPDVRPGVDLVVEATRTGYEQFLVVKDRAAVAQVRSVTLALRSANLRYAATGDGGLAVTDNAGRRVGYSPAPVMWDAQVAPTSGERLRRTPVQSHAVGRGAGRTDVVLTPDAAWLSDPATQFPVTIDPQETWGASFDTFVQTGYVDDQSGSTELKLGFVDDGGSWVARSFLTWPTSRLAGKQVTAATLYLWETHSWSCTAANWQVWTTGQASTATRWTSQPSWLFQEAISNQTKGYTSSCADGWVSADARNFFVRAANIAISVELSSATARPGSLPSTYQARITARTVSINAARPIS